MKQEKISTKIAGVDVGKRCLDVAVYGLEEQVQVGNDAAGLEELVRWLRTREVLRVGLEASGGYERKAVARLGAAGFEVVLHQPLEVRLFARLKRMRAKTDRINARVIAAATSQVDAVKAASDPRLQALADRMTAYEHITDQLAALKTFMEHVSLKDVTLDLKAQIASLARLKAKLARKVLEAIKAHADLLARYRLLRSLPGAGPIVAAGLLIRFPELGAMKRGQASSLLGVAPFARDSGQFKGQRFIGGGRSRPRRLMYLAALAAKRFDPGLRAFAERLAALGKPPKVVTVAVMRKLIEAANLVLSRGQPWVKRPAT
jgi:transposase